MASPFPGMDPYLEAHWRDVHASMVVYISNALQDHLPAELRARIEERVVPEMSGASARRLRAEVWPPPRRSSSRRSAS